MPPLVLEGNTLGKKHQHFNKLVKELSASAARPADINFQHNDVQNLINIDIASNNKDVEYILKVLKCEDELYVSRAIKRCTWLITDDQYSDVINPRHLHDVLFPEMTLKARHKLLLHIRIHLKNEARVEQFVDYYMDKEPKVAYKWLPNCSLSYIHKVMEEKYDDIEPAQRLRLYERSFEALEIYVKKMISNSRGLYRALDGTTELLNTHTEQYLDLVEKIDYWNMPKFGPKATKIVMKKCPQRFMDKFEFYVKHIDMGTFAKHMKKEEIKSFVLKQIKNEKINKWFDYETMKHFAKHLPKEDRFEFVKQVFIDKSYKDDDIVKPMSCAVLDMCSARSESVGMCKSAQYSNVISSSNANIYRWYRFAPFNEAFPDLKKLIRNESSPDERNAMFEALLVSAAGKMKHLHLLLQYYHDKHINEPANLKIKFISNVLSLTTPYRYDVKTWNILNTLYYSLDIYSESDATFSSISNCIESIILYKLLNNEPVPEVLQKKVTFSTMKKYRKKLNDTEQETLYNYLHNQLKIKIEIKITTEKEFQSVLVALADLMQLLIDWDKKLEDTPWIVNKIKELVQLNKNQKWNINLADIYNKNKSWRKLLFAESIAMNDTEETYINILKHAPENLISKDNMESICTNKTAVRRLLRKVRIYWPNTVTQNFITAYRGKLEEINAIPASVRALFVLLPKEKALEIIKQYEPSEFKINWTDTDEVMLLKRKHIAGKMHIVRPPVEPDTVMFYAKGDYLKYAMPSLDAILYNLKPSKSREYVTKVLDAPVSLQKHGIRLASQKLNIEQVKQIFSDIWGSSKNPSIRTNIFTLTFKLLSKEKNPSSIEQLADVLKMLIDNLSKEENKKIYTTLAKVEDLPISVRPEIVVKSYRLLKSLPTKLKIEPVMLQIVIAIPALMESLDEKFIVEDILQDFIENVYKVKRFDYYGHKCHLSILSMYLLSCNNDDLQSSRFNTIFTKIIDIAVATWHVMDKSNEYFIRFNLDDILSQIQSCYRDKILGTTVMTPVNLFQDIQNTIETSFSGNDTYSMLTNWKLATAYINLVNDFKPIFEDDIPKENKDKLIEEMLIKITPHFGKIVLQYLKEDVNKYFPSIRKFFLEALQQLNNKLHLSEIEWDVSKIILEDQEFISGHLLVIDSLPNYEEHEEHRKKKVSELHKMITSHPSAEVKLYHTQTFKYRQNVMPLDK